MSELRLAPDGARFRAYPARRESTEQATRRATRGSRQLGSVKSSRSVRNDRGTPRKSSIARPSRSMAGGPMTLAALRVPPTVARQSEHAPIAANARQHGPTQPGSSPPEASARNQQADEQESLPDELPMMRASRVREICGVGELREGWAPTQSASDRILGESTLPRKAPIAYKSPGMTRYLSPALQISLVRWPSEAVDSDRNRVFSIDRRA